MTNPQNARRYRFTAPLLFVLAGSLVLSGCRPKEEIRTYRIAKPTDSDPAPPAAEPRATTPPVNRAERSAEPTDRMLGAIVPGSDQAWFFKAVGSREQIDQLAEPIKSFLQSVRLEDGKPTWELPDGWTEEPAGGMRLATLQIPTGGEGSEIEMSVIGLGLSDDWDALVLDNVNRWRQQLDQPPLESDGLADATSPMPEVAEQAVMIDETGWFESDGMTPPFAGETTLNRSTPAIPINPPSVRLTLKGDKPEGWKAGKTSAMRQASFITPGDAEVTAFVFAAAGQMGDVLENVNRWRGEVKLPPLSEEQLAEETEEMTLLGNPGRYFELVGEDETTYAAMVVRGEEVWFFKLRGPTAAVEEQRDEFRAWLDSLSLS